MEVSPGSPGQFQKGHGSKSGDPSGKSGLIFGD